MTEEVRINTYEGMFLFPQAALSDLDGTIGHLKELLARAEASVISLGKWDERRLAYDIKGNKRGLYLICYFNAPAQKMAALERACNLSERVLRTMFVRADGIPEETMKAVGDEQRLRDELALRRTEAPSEYDEEQAEPADEVETAEA